MIVLATQQRKQCPGLNRSSPRFHGRCNRHHDLVPHKWLTLQVRMMWMTKSYWCHSSVVVLFCFSLCEDVDLVFLVAE